MTSSRAGKARLTALLWMINLSSISASVLVYIYLSYYAYRRLDSILLSEFVLFAPMVIPVVFAFPISRITSFLGARQLLLLANLAGVLVCLAIFSMLDLHPSVVLLGATAIGALDAIQRVTRIVVIKQYFSAVEVGFTVPLTLTAQFIAGGVAGAMLAFFPEQITSSAITVATVILFVLAALGAAALPARDAPHAGSGDQRVRVRFLQLLRDNQDLRSSLTAFVVLGTFFQGFYNVSRVALPAHHLGLSQHHVGLLQVVASSAALAGALFFYVFSRRGMRFHLPWLYLGCALPMVASCVVGSPAASFALYFVYFFVFELAFFKLQAAIMSASPSSQMPLIATAQYAWVYAGMMAAIFVGAFLVKAFGLTVTAFCFAGGFAAVQIFLWMCPTRRVIAAPASAASRF